MTDAIDHHKAVQTVLAKMQLEVMVALKKLEAELERWSNLQPLIPE